MALENPLSPANMMSALSPYTDFSLSPDSPAQRDSARFQTTLSARNSGDSSSLHPHSMEHGTSPGGFSDMVGPSPVTSNGTDATEIEDDVSEDIHGHEDRDEEEREEEGEEEEAESSPPRKHSSPESQTTLKRISTSIPEYLRTSIDDESVSVIHAPEGYQNFSSKSASKTSPPLRRRSTNSPPSNSPSDRARSFIPDRATPTPYEERDIHPPMIEDLDTPQGQNNLNSAPPLLATNVAPVKFGIDAPTPRAQTRQEVEALAHARASSLGNLEGIPEEQRDDEDDDEDGFDPRNVPHKSEEEVLALKTALNECWTLCNTLASLSSIHRERIFSNSGTGDDHETAWKCCWRLCQKLYESRDEDHELYVRPTLDMCRDFCQALFEVRQRKDEFADSVLRVSFELNNHLYNTHDRTLPEAFRERTLDFYITLCHRLMKQRNELAEETDALLRACWSLAEMLFSLRQNKKDGKPADEELLGSAVQACWELCDLFREGWTQVRPERGTPRASQTTFTQVSDQMSRSTSVQSKRESLPTVSETASPPRMHSRPRYHEPDTPGWTPETPTTEFEDTPVSPEHSPNIPNILVLGTEGSRASNARWSSNSSAYSTGSAKSSSTITSTTKPDEDVNLTRLKVLILKAAMNVGFSRSPSPSGSKDPPALQAFVKGLPTGSFGSLPSHAQLLTAYRNLVLSDSTFRSASNLPPPGRKAMASDVAKSVGWMMRSGQYTFLKDLFRLVFGFQVEEAEKRKNVSISV